MGVLNKYSVEGFYYHHTSDESASPDVFSAHFHDMYELLCVIKGDGTFFIEGTPYPVTDGTVFFVRPGRTHLMQIHDGSRYERTAVHFSKNIIPPAFFTEPSLHKALETDNRYLISEIESALRLTDIPDSLCGNVLYTVTVSRLISFLCDLSFAVINNPLPSNSAQLNPLGSALEYINSHLCEKITLSDVSKACYLSRSQLTRVFRAQIGTTVGEYIVNKKLMLAKEMIASGENASAVCDKCGFGDYSTFYRAYLRHMGTPPVRKSRKTNNNP